jgi:hypothetical protein
MMSASGAHEQVDSAILARAGGSLEERKAYTATEVAKYVANIREAIEDACQHRLYHVARNVPGMAAHGVVTHLRSLGYACSVRVDKELQDFPIIVTIVW